MDNINENSEQVEHHLDTQFGNDHQEYENNGNLEHFQSKSQFRNSDYQDGYNDGYQYGYQDGYQDGFQDGHHDGNQDGDFHNQNKEGYHNRGYSSRGNFDYRNQRNGNDYQGNFENLDNSDNFDNRNNGNNEICEYCAGKGHVYENCRTLTRMIQAGKVSPSWSPEEFEAEQNDRPINPRFI